MLVCLFSCDRPYKLHKDFSFHIINRHSATMEHQNISVPLASQNLFFMILLSFSKLECSSLINFERIWRMMQWFMPLGESLCKCKMEGSSDRDRIKAHCCMANHITLVSWPTQTFPCPTLVRFSCGTLLEKSQNVDLLTAAVMTLYKTQLW